MAGLQACRFISLLLPTQATSKGARMTFTKWPHNIYNFFFRRERKLSEWETLNTHSLLLLSPECRVGPLFHSLVAAQQLHLLHLGAPKALAQGAQPPSLTTSICLPRPSKCLHLDHGGKKCFPPATSLSIVLERSFVSFHSNSTVWPRVARHTISTHHSKHPILLLLSPSFIGKKYPQEIQTSTPNSDP